MDRRHPLDAAVDNAEAGDDHVIMRRGRPVAVLVGIDRYDELTAELERLSPSGGAPQPEADDR